MARPLIKRLVYTAGTAAALPVLLFLWVASFYALAVLAMLVTFMFSGGHGGGGDTLLTGLSVSAFHFVGGAIGGAGIAALLNAMVEPRPFWVRTIGSAALAGGIFAAVHPAAGPPMDAFAKAVIASFNDPGGRQENEESRAIAYAKHHAKVIAVLGDKDLKGGISASRLQSGRALSYQVSLQGEKYGYAVINVSRASGGAEFSLVCVQLLGPQSPPATLACTF